MQNLQRWILITIWLGLLLFYNNCSLGFKMEPDYLKSLSSSQSIQYPELYKQGQKLYAAKCASCHGAFDNSTKKNALIGDIFEGAKRIEQMNFVSSIPLDDLEAIAYALNPAGTVRDDEYQEPLVTWEELQTKSCQSVSVARDLNILDKEQYKNIILDTFNYTIDVSELPQQLSDVFTKQASTGGSSVQNIAHFEQLYAIADTISSYLESNITTVNNLFGKCDITLLSCQQTNLKKILTKLFRKEITDTDADYIKIKAKFSTKTEFKDVLKAVSLTALMHPRFLFLLEYQPGLRSNPLAQNVSRPLSNYEIASRLSFFLWNSSPDDTLLLAAKNGLLLQSSQLKTQIQRMLNDAKSQRFIKKFTWEWLKLNSLDELEKDMDTFTNSDLLISSMKSETEQFASAHLKKGIDFRTFFTSSETYVNSTLATHYGLAGISGSAFVKVIRPQATLHGGVLAQSSIALLTSRNNTSPIHRGIFNYQRFLCGELGTPPDNANSVELPGTSKLDQLKGRSSLKSCSVCHSKFEPMGYVAEELSSWGQPRTVDEQGDAIGQEVDWIHSTKMSSLSDLGLLLSNNSKVGLCLSENLVKYALRTAIANTPEIECQNHNNLVAAYKAGNSFSEYIESVVLSSLFTSRLEEK